MHREGKDDKTEELPLMRQLQSGCTKSGHFRAGEALQVLTHLHNSPSSVNLHDMKVNSENAPEHLNRGVCGCSYIYFGRYVSEQTITVKHDCCQFQTLIFIISPGL